jgi:hypothetical protein
MTMKSVILNKAILSGLLAATAFSATAPAFAQRNEGGQTWQNSGGRGHGDGQHGDGQRGDRSQAYSGRNADGGRDNRQAMPQVQAQAPMQQAPVQQRQARVDTAPIQNQQQRQRYEGMRANEGNLSQQRSQAEVLRQAQFRDRQASDQRNMNRDGRDSNATWRSGADNRQDGRRDVRGDPRADGRNVPVDNNRNGRDGRGDNRNWSNSGGWNNGGYNNDRRYSGNGRIDDRQRWAGQRRWDNGWRNDRRYDWQQHRDRYRDTYHLGRYSAPRGWSYGYRPFSVGIYLDNMLYSNNYWLDDPYEYRLPPAYGSMRWIRYYDDALLVDTRDGYVVDVIRDFFW